MFPCTGFGFGFWWIFPLIMLAMMALCFFMMRGHMGSMMCRPGFGSFGSHKESASDRPLDILGKRYAQGEINKQEYEDKKKEIARRTSHPQET